MGLVGWGLSVGAIGLALSGCTDPLCSCTSPGVRLKVDPAKAATVGNIYLSGTPCMGMTAACDQMTATGCAEYSFTGQAEGKCTIDVSFNDGFPNFRQDVVFSASNGCCAGFLPDPANADVMVRSFREPR
jgi:hypothetical protein